MNSLHEKSLNFDIREQAAAVVMFLTGRQPPASVKQGTGGQAIT